MPRQNLSDKPIAVLIDAENVSLTVLPRVLKKCEEFGPVALRRAYGDFSLRNLKEWQEGTSRLAIQPVHQFRIVDGKSLSDSALIVDAMDLLHSRRFGAFCFVSSDSDFTRLALRIREDGLAVYGFGEEKTHKTFVSACNEFVLLNTINSAASGGDASPAVGLAKDDEGMKLRRVSRMIEAIEREKGKVLLSVLGKRLKEELSVREVKDYLGKKLKDFLEAHPKKFKVVPIDNILHVKLP